MLTDIQIKYINSTLDRLNLQEIAEKMRVTNLEQQLHADGYLFSSKEKKYIKKEAVEQLDVDLDYKKLMQMDAVENFSVRIDPIIKVKWEALLATTKFKKIPKGKLLSLAILEFIEKYK